MTRSNAYTIVLASGNMGKLAELRALLGKLATVRSAAEFGAELPEETGTTFEENAILKAIAVAEQTGHIALADDSGLEVDALDGAPGVYSARYAGPDATDERNTEKLLEALDNVADKRRTARFRCAIAIAFSPDDVQTTFGTCEGRIERAPRGTGGFGYDPVFGFPDGRTMAQLSSEEKNSISHRAHAMSDAVTMLRNRLEASSSTEKDQ